MEKHGFNLGKIVHISDKIKQVSKKSLKRQDYLLVKTLNSLYKIQKIEDNLYEISGGWFDKKGISPSRMNIRGCTWGGSIIHINMLAACGLCVEFSNNVITSPVSQVIIIKAGNLN